RLSGAGSCAEIGHLAGPSAATSAQRRLSGPAPTACPRLAQELLIGSGMGIRVCLSELLLELRIAVGDIAAMAGIVLPGLICSRNAKVGMIEFVVVDDVDVDPSRIPIVIGPYGRSDHDRSPEADDADGHVSGRVPVERAVYRPRPNPVG